MRINVVKKNLIERVLQRKRWHEPSPDELDLKDMLRIILKWANEFVPSQSGSILLDDPVLDESQKKPGRLYFVACFGKGSKSLAGTFIPVKAGIAGKAYTEGRACISKDVSVDANFYDEIDRRTRYTTKSLICVPIQIKGTTIGVLELVNRVGKKSYDRIDLTLLGIFANYTSTLIQNFLDAKVFSELSIKDNLTGLYNDRYFFDRLSKEVRGAVFKNKDLSLVFFDLDRFKEVNDTHGHLAGSQLLKEVGGILKSYSNGDIISIRYGGDEFVVILPGAGIGEAEIFAENVRKEIEGFTFLKEKVPGKVDALKIKGLITGSFGIASLRKNVSKNAPVREIRDALIKAADTAMYVSKQTGRNSVTAAKGVFIFH